MKIYVDCVENGGSFSGSGGSLQYSNLPGNIGRHDRNLTEPADYFKGAIDDFKYWDRELTIQEVEDLCSTLNVNEYNNEKAFITLFPNPTNGILNFKTNLINVYRIEIYNPLGQKIISKKELSPINLSGLAKGVYLFKIYSKHSPIIKKIIIE